MSDLKPMSAAEYAAHSESVDSKRPTVIKTLKSGAVFELRKPDLQRMVILGLIPQSLLDEGVRAWEASGIKQKAQTAPSLLSLESTKNGLIAMREVVQDACVMPPFNEITAKSFLKQDFDEIFFWAMGHEGVAASAGARSFRKGRKRATADLGTDGKKLQPETVSTDSN